MNESWPGRGGGPGHHPSRRLEEKLDELLKDHKKEATWKKRVKQEDDNDVWEGGEVGEEGKKN